MGNGRLARNSAGHVAAFRLGMQRGGDWATRLMKSNFRAAYRVGNKGVTALVLCLIPVVK